MGRVLTQGQTVGMALRVVGGWWREKSRGLLLDLE